MFLSLGFGAVQVELEDNVNLSPPIFEWLLTDQCGNNPYQATKYPDSLVNFGASKSIVAAWGAFFGNAYSGSELQLVTDQLPIGSSASLSVFFWFKLITPSSDFTLMQIDFPDASIQQRLLLKYQQTMLSVSCDFQSKL